MSQVTLFISAVTSEFAEDPATSPERVRGPGDYRTYLRDKLTGPDVSVKVQEDFIAGGVLTLDKLVLYLKECDAVIQLVGDMTGAVASGIAVESLFEAEPQLPRKVPFLATPADAAALAVSYTQWEGYLAHYYGKRLLVCAADPHASRAGRHVTSEEQRKSQDAHLARLKQLERYPEILFASREELVIEVLRTLRTVLPPAKSESLPAAPLRLPYASLGELFIGRDEFLEGIRASVAKAKKAGAWPKQVVHGLGGMGKTRLVVEYAWRYRDEYTAVLLVNGESAESLDRELASLTGVFHLDVDASAPEPQRTQLALEWLKNHPGWLLLVDNVDSEDARHAVAGRLPDWSNGHVLITGRVTRWPRDVEPLDLRVLSAPDATRFLLDATESGRSVRDDDLEQAELLANGELGALCLALEQAAAYIDKLELSLAEYRTRWATNAKDVRSRADKSMMRYHEEKDVSLSVATTWQTTVEDLSAAAKALLRMFSWLAPEGISLAMLEHPGMIEQLNAIAGADSDIEEALAELRSFSLLSRRQSGRFESAGQVHRLVQLVTRDRLSDEEKRRTFIAMLTVLVAYAGIETEHYRVSIMDETSPHLDAAISHGDKLGYEREIAPALREQGTQLLNRGLYSGAETPLRRALAIDKAQYGDGHADVAEDLRRLGDVLIELGRYREAELHLRNAAAIIEARLGEDEARLEPILNSLCLVLFCDERHEEAESIVTRALRINELHHGKEHHSSVDSQLHLAQILWRTGRLSEAIAVSRRALAIAESRHGVDTIDSYHSLGLLGKLLNGADELDEAERLIRRLIAVYESSIGNTHPLYADALTDLGRVLVKQGRWAEAEPHLRQALIISDRTRPETHPEVYFLLASYAHVLAMLHRQEEEEPLCRRLLTIAIRDHGDAAPQAAQALSRLGSCLLEQGKVDEAEASFRRALAIDEAHFGANSPETFSDLTGLGRVAEAAKRYDEAERLFQRAIDACDPSDESRALSVAMSYMRRGHALRALGRLREAEEPLRRTLLLAEQECPPGHFIIARSLVELAQVIESLDRPAEAAPLLRRALAIVNEWPDEERTKFEFSQAQLALIDGAFTSASVAPVKGLE
jgi:tetratricopeptide (TPR) repeat protein